MARCIMFDSLSMFTWLATLTGNQLQTLAA